MIERLKHEERITRRSFLSHALIIAGAFGIGAVGGIVVATPTCWLVTTEEFKEKMSEVLRDHKNDKGK